MTPFAHRKKCRIHPLGDILYFSACGNHTQHDPRKFSYTHNALRHCISRTCTRRETQLGIYLQNSAAFAFLAICLFSRLHHYRRLSMRCQGEKEGRTGRQGKKTYGEHASLRMIHLADKPYGRCRRAEALRLLFRN